MLKVNSYSAKGVKLLAITLPKEWDLAVTTKNHTALLSQAVRVYIDRNHIGLRSTKTRSEVNRTTKKLYKQKGTGGARHGSKSAPIFVGGGVALGPRPLKRELTLPKAMRRKAVAIALSLAVKEGKVIAGDLNFSKTKDANKFIKKVIEKDIKRVTFIVTKENLKVIKFLRNIKNVTVKIFPSFNALDIFVGGLIVFDKTIFNKTKKETKTK